MLTTHNIDIQAMLVWLTLPFYDNSIRDSRLFPSMFHSPSKKSDIPDMKNSSFRLREGNNSFRTGERTTGIVCLNYVNQQRCNAVWTRKNHCKLNKACRFRHKFDDNHLYESIHITRVHGLTARQQVPWVLNTDSLYRPQGDQTLHVQR